MEVATNTRWLVLVEGPSDKAALEALARRRGRDLAAAGAEIVSIGGAQAIGRFLVHLAPDVRAAGLCDAGETGAFGRALERAGIGPASTRAELELLGFYVCDPDLEGELIRSLGAAGVEAVLERTGKLSSFRTSEKQPQWEGRPVGCINSARLAESPRLQENRVLCAAHRRDAHTRRGSACRGKIPLSTQVRKRVRLGQK